MSWFDILKIDWDGPGGMKEKVNEMQRNLDEGVFAPLNEWADEMNEAEQQRQQRLRDYNSSSASSKPQLNPQPKPKGTATAMPEERRTVNDVYEELFPSHLIQENADADSDPEPEKPNITGSEDADIEAGIEYNNKKLEWLKRQGNQVNKSMWFEMLKIEETEIDVGDDKQHPGYRTTVRLKNADGSELRCKVCHRNKWNRTPDDDYKKYMCKNCGYGAIDRPKSKSQIRRDNSRTPSKKQKNRERREARRKKRAARRKDRW